MPVQSELFMNVVLAVGGTAYSQPVDLQGNNTVFVMISTIVGSGLAATTTVLEGSSDLSNWATITGSFATGAAPTTADKTYTGVGAKYVRLKLVNGSGSAGVFNATLTASRS
jgi:hypothetical protein